MIYLSAILLYGTPFQARVLSFYRSTMLTLNTFSKSSCLFFDELYYKFLLLVDRWTSSDLLNTFITFSFSVIYPVFYFLYVKSEYFLKSLKIDMLLINIYYNQTLIICCLKLFYLHKYHFFDSFPTFASIKFDNSYT